MAVINVSDLTAGEGSLTGTGVFDELMRATETHIQQEYSKGRIKGPEYATVYLGAIQAAMDRSLQFLLSRQKADLEAELLQEQVKNAQADHAVLVAQECKLRAEFDLIQKQMLKAVSETTLLSQKTETEKAQVDGRNVYEDSVIGRQLILYKNQGEGYIRDAEQRAAKIMIDTFNIRHSANHAPTPATDQNKLKDEYIGQAIDKLLTGIQ